MKNIGFYIYRFLDDKNEVIYIGKTTDIHNRIKNHFSGKGHLSENCYLECERIQFLNCNSGIEMDIGEIYLINKYKPKYNKSSKYESEQNVNLNLDECWNNLYIDTYKIKFKYIKFREDVLVEMTKELKELKKQQLDIQNKIESIENTIQNYNELKNYIGKNVDYLKHVEEVDKEHSQALLKVVEKILEFVNNNEYEDELYKIVSDNIIAINITELYHTVRVDNLDLNSFRKILKKSGLLQLYNGEFTKSMRFKQNVKKVHFVNLTVLEYLSQT